MGSCEDKKGCCPVSACAGKVCCFFGKFEILGQCLLLLILRVYFGYQFFLAGKGKFENFDRTVGFFEKIQIPFPEINVYLAGGAELIGGLLLIIGLGSRLVSLPLIFTMIIAYVTAHNAELMAIFSDTEKFLSASPFLYLLTSLIILLFGPGCFSVDKLIGKKFCKGKNDDSGCCDKTTECCNKDAEE